MVILDLEACPKNYLKVRSGIWLEMAKIKFFGKFDRGVDFLIAGQESDSKNLNTSIMSFMTCVQNLKSIGRDLIGFDVVCRI